MTDHWPASTPTPSARPGPARGHRDLARQAREIARRHPWLAGLMQRPMLPGLNGLRHLDYFLGQLAGSGLDTGASWKSSP